MTAAGLPAALAAGAALAGPLWPPATPSAAQVAGGAGGVALYVVVAAFAVGSVVAGFVAIGGLATVAASTAVAEMTGASPATPVAVALALVVVLSTAFPLLSLRLGRLPLPRISLDIATFRAGEEPTQATLLTGRTEAATAALTGLLWALACAVPTGTCVLLATHDRWAWGLGAAAGVALLARSRAYGGIQQRGALLLGGAAAAAAAAGRFAVAGGPASGFAAIATCVIIGSGAAVHATRAPAGSPSPYWSRALDALEIISVTALVPLVLAVTGLYARIRGIGN